MDAHKRYTLSLLSLILAMMLMLVATGYYLEPLIGDVTRIGDYAENDFGWNRVQPVFVQDASPLRNNYDEYADVLVLGDSFSFGGLFGMLNFPWQTFLAAETGLSMTTISNYTHTVPPTYDPGLLPRIVNSDAFQKAPPKVLIFEIVERQLHMLPEFAGNCRSEYKIEHRLDISPNPRQLPQIDAYRKKIPHPLKERIAYAQKYLFGMFQRQWDKKPAVYQLELASPRLFSNKLNARILIYEGDVKKKSLVERDIDSMRCKLINAQNLVQKNGKTLFLAMIAPDKLTAYSGRLKDQSYANLSVIERLASNSFLHLPRLDRAMQAAVDDGVMDVYLPDDTHWASSGHKIAAAELAKYLANFHGD